MRIKDPFGIVAKPSIVAGIHLGFYGQMTINNNLSFAPEFQFTQRGSRTNIINPEHERINVNFIEFPLLLSYKLSSKFFLDVGVSSNYSFSSNDLAKSIFEKEIDLGLCVGFKFTVNETFLIVTRYYHGLTSLIDHLIIKDIYGNISLVYFYNQSLSIGLGYKLSSHRSLNKSKGTN